MDQSEVQHKMLEIMQRYRRNYREILNGKIGHSEYVYLQMIFKHAQSHPAEQGIKVSRLAENMQCSPPSVSRTLRSLEEKNLVLREVNPKDRRNTYISLTEFGESVREEMGAHIDLFTKKVYDAIGEEKIRQMMVLAEELADAMEAAQREMQKMKPENDRNK